MHNTEFSFVAHIAHPPVQVPLVVICERLLVKRVAVRHFEDLLEKVLLLYRYHQVNLWRYNFVFEHIFCVFRQLNSVQCLLLQLDLLHIDHSCKEVGALNNLIIEDVLLVCSDAVAAASVFLEHELGQLMSRKQFFGWSIVVHDEEPRVDKASGVRLSEIAGIFNLKV